MSMGSSRRHYAILVGALALVLFAASAGSARAADGYVTSFDGTKIVYSFFPDPALEGRADGTDGDVRPRATRRPEPTALTPP